MSDVDLHPSPPAQGVWWDPAATLAAVLAQLRLTGTDIDENRLEALIPAAGRHINDYLDREADISPPALPTLQAALERVTIALYYGIVGDPIDVVKAQLLAAKERFGIA